MLDSEIEEYLVRLDKEVINFKTELFKISWFMRGGVNVNDLFHKYTTEDLNILSEIIKENIETTKQSQLPLL
jgi:hypothetical protein